MTVNSFKRKLVEACVSISKLSINGQTVKLIRGGKKDVKELPDTVSDEFPLEGNSSLNPLLGVSVLNILGKTPAELLTQELWLWVHGLHKPSMTFEDASEILNVSRDSSVYNCSGSRMHLDGDIFTLATSEMSLPDLNGKYNTQSNTQNNINDSAVHLDSDSGADSKASIQQVVLFIIDQVALASKLKARQRVLCVISVGENVVYKGNPNFVKSPQKRYPISADIREGFLGLSNYISESILISFYDEKLLPGTSPVSRTPVFRVAMDPRIGTPNESAGLSSIGCVMIRVPLAPTPRGFSVYPVTDNKTGKPVGRVTIRFGFKELKTGIPTQGIMNGLNQSQYLNHASQKTLSKNNPVFSDVLNLFLFPEGQVMSQVKCDCVLTQTELRFSIYSKASSTLLGALPLSYIKEAIPNDGEFVYSPRSFELVTSIKDKKTLQDLFFGNSFLSTLPTQKPESEFFSIFAFTESDKSPKVWIDKINKLKAL